MSDMARVLIVALLTLGTACSGRGTVRTFQGDRPSGGNKIVGSAPDMGPKPGPAEQSRAAPEPLFRKAVCNGVCVDITLDAIDDYEFTRRYLESIGRRIILNVVYPWETVEKGAEGEVEIQVKVDRKGTMISSKIVRGSGKSLLDNAALNSISASAPFNPFPSSPYVQSLRFKARFLYSQ